MIAGRRIPGTCAVRRAGTGAGRRQRPSSGLSFHRNFRATEPGTQVSSSRPLLQRFYDCDGGFGPRHVSSRLHASCSKRSDPKTKNSSVASRALGRTAPLTKTVGEPNVPRDTASSVFAVRSSLAASEAELSTSAFASASETPARAKAAWNRVGSTERLLSAERSDGSAWIASEKPSASCGRTTRRADLIEVGCCTTRVGVCVEGLDSVFDGRSNTPLVDALAKTRELLPHSGCAVPAEQHGPLP